MGGIALFMGVSPAILAQDFAIGHTTVSFTDAARNREIPVEIYYPADSAGDNVPLPASTGASFPSVVFGHGFVMGWDAYENIWEALVPKGFILLFPKTETGILPSHLEFGRDISFVANQIGLLGQSEPSLFYNRVADATAVMGHSMGGGAAFLAAQLNPDIDALVTLAPAETNPSAIAAAAAVSASALVVSAGNDCVTPPSSNQLPMYEALAGGCKTYVNILGGSHCQMADFNLLCQFGETTCSPSPTISRAEQHQTLTEYILPWLQAQLLQNCDAGATFNDLIAADPRVSFERNCEQCETLNLAKYNAGKFSVLPNPFDGFIRLEAVTGANHTMMIYDASSRLVWRGDFNQELYIDTDAFQAGLYLYEVWAQGQKLKMGKLIKK